MRLWAGQALLSKSLCKQTSEGPKVTPSATAWRGGLGKTWMTRNHQRPGGEYPGRRAGQRQEACSIQQTRKRLVSMETAAFTGTCEPRRHGSGYPQSGRPSQVSCQSDRMWHFRGLIWPLIEGDRKETKGAVRNQLGDRLHNPGGPWVAQARTQRNKKHGLQSEEKSSSRELE